MAYFRKFLSAYSHHFFTTAFAFAVLAAVMTSFAAAADDFTIEENTNYFGGIITPSRSRTAIFTLVWRRAERMFSAARSLSARRGRNARSWLSFSDAAAISAFDENAVGMTLDTRLRENFG